jgi:hypothetical protein
MGEIDGYKYPGLDSEEAINIADVLVNQHGGEVKSEETFAQDIGHSSAKSGAYKQKIADVRKWGLLPSRGLEATELAFRLANPESSESERRARFEMYQNIRLLEQLYDHLDGREPPSEFWRVLTEIADTNPKNAKEAAPEIRQLYESMLDNVDDDESTNATDDSEIIEESAPHRADVPVSDEGVYLQIGDDTLALGEITVMNLELAKVMIEQKKEELKQKQAVSDGQESKTTSGANLSEFTS